MKLRRLMIPAWLSLMILLLASPPVQAYSAYFLCDPDLGAVAGMRDSRVRGLAHGLPGRQGGNPGADAHGLVQGAPGGQARRHRLDTQRLAQFQSGPKKRGFAYLLCQQRQSAPEGASPAGGQRPHHVELQRPGGNAGGRHQRLGPGAGPEDQRGGLGAAVVSVRDCDEFSATVQAPPGSGPQGAAPGGAGAGETQRDVSHVGCACAP